MARLGRGFPNNALMRQVPPRLPVAYDSTGAGNSLASVANGGTISWTHLIGVGANAITASVGVYVPSSTVSLTCKVGSMSMPIQVQSTNFYENTANSYYMSIITFGVLNPPTGNQTITVTNSTGVAANGMVGNSTAYSNVGSFGIGSSKSGAGASLSHSINSAAGQMLVQAATEGNATTASGSFSSYSQSSRSNIAGSPDWPFIMGDAPGAPTVNFTATVPGTSQTWGSVVLPLLPI